LLQVSGRDVEAVVVALAVELTTIDVGVAEVELMVVAGVEVFDSVAGLAKHPHADRRS